MLFVGRCALPIPPLLDSGSSGSTNLCSGERYTSYLILAHANRINGIPRSGGNRLDKSPFKLDGSPTLALAKDQQQYGFVTVWRSDLSLVSVDWE